MLLKSGAAGKTAIFMLIRSIFLTEMLPGQLTEDVVRAIYKKGSPFEGSNYRPVSLLSVVAKLFQRVVVTRLRNWLSKPASLVSNPRFQLHLKLKLGLLK